MHGIIRNANLLIFIINFILLHFVLSYLSSKLFQCFLPENRKKNRQQQQQANITLRFTMAEAPSNIFSQHSYILFCKRHTRVSGKMVCEGKRRRS